jgi:hypothetical protein
MKGKKEGEEKMGGMTPDCRKIWWGILDATAGVVCARKFIEAPVHVVLR